MPHDLLNSCLLPHVKLKNDGYQKLEAICREFFGGLGEQGNPKIALIAWENVLQSKLGGGLELIDFYRMSRAMKYKSVLKLLSNYDSKWVSLAYALTQKGITKGRWAKEMRSWTTQDFLLLSPKAHIPSRMLRGLLAGWTEPSSILDLWQGHLPTSLSVSTLYLCNRG